VDREIALNAEVTGGTGRFAHATDSFTLGGQIDFTTTPPSFVLPWQGAINFIGTDDKAPISQG
jgi:hypothetical protein